jgi:hypothetical protein
VDPNAAITKTGGADFTVWLVMFGVLIVVALVLAYLSRGMEK